MLAPSARAQSPADPAPVQTPAPSPAPSPTPPPWANESELGIATVAGNAESETYNAKQTTTYGIDGSRLKISGRYLESKNGGVLAAKNWDASLRYDKDLSRRFTVFASHGLESDVFAGYVQFNNSDVGFRYEIAKSKPTQWLVEAGYRYTFANYVTESPVDPVSHIVRVYSEFGQALTATSSFKFWIEGLPDLRTTVNYRINLEPSLVAQINSTFALKAGYLIKYQNRILAPATTNTDRFFTTAIVAKF